MHNVPGTELICKEQELWLVFNRPIFYSSYQANLKHIKKSDSMAYVSEENEFSETIYTESQKSDL